MKKKLSYSVIYAPVREGGYSAFFPVFPKITVWSPTLKECRKAAAEALQLHLDGLHELGEKPPLERRIVRGSLRVEVG